MIKMTEERSNDGLARYPNIATTHFAFLQPDALDSNLTAQMKKLGLKLAKVQCLGGRGSGRGRWEGSLVRIHKEVTKGERRVEQGKLPKLNLDLLENYTPVLEMQSNMDRFVATVFACGLLSARTFEQSQYLAPTSHTFKGFLASTIRCRFTLKVGSELPLAYQKYSLLHAKMARFRCGTAAKPPARGHSLPQSIS